MARYLIRRLLLLLVVIFGVITIAFFLMHLTPGDPARTFLGRRPRRRRSRHCGTAGDLIRVSAASTSGSSARRSPDGSVIRCTSVRRSSNFSPYGFPSRWR
ncbi:hypothetical protein [Microlunatus sp. Gsoil 973]|uniref:hypothetical protein n=1 Tax=Microlunatus sp. Gsoil 973 TaxID=2672569 RepID=UPI0018A85A9A|nr:hypothetical protein [Microlunatus sp. Gsoil 973]